MARSPSSGARVRAKLTAFDRRSIARTARVNRIAAAVAICNHDGRGATRKQTFDHRIDICYEQTLTREGFERRVSHAFRRGPVAFLIARSGLRGGKP